MTWNAASKTLSGTANVVGGELFRIVLAQNGAKAIKTTAMDAVATLEPNATEGNLVTLIINSKENKSIPWIVQFE